MSWECSKCGASGSPNKKEILGFVLLNGCVNCIEIKLPKMCNKCSHGPCVCRSGNKRIGQSLKEIRLAKGFTLRHIKSKCGVSNPYLSQVENGKVKEISFRKLSVLCKFYEIDIKYFEQFI